MLFLLVAAAHPTLPTAWEATVNEAQVGLVKESYIFVDKPTPENPSGKWTNYTDGSCQRLIYVPTDAGAKRYLLGCDAVACCTEQQSGNHKVYQIPDVHPAFLAPVHSLGQSVLTQSLNGKQITTTVDTWSWKFTFLSTNASTSNGTDGTTVLNRWSVGEQGQVFVNDYFDFKAIADADLPAFQSQFHVPDQCKAPNTPNCGDAHAQGLLSAEKLRFAQAETLTPVPATDDDCCLNGDCCHGVEFCCDTCNGSCTCSVHGKCGGVLV